MVRSCMLKSVSGVFSGNIFHKVIERLMHSLHDKYFKEIGTLQKVSLKNGIKMV